jgi:transcriptional regulator with XRE-family HTH domain
MPDTIEIDGPGAMIRWAREQAGMSQTDLGAVMHIAHQQVGRWERGMNVPTADTFIEALQACGYDVVLEPREASE